MNGSNREKVVAYVMTKNEESIIGDCLDSLKWADEVVVADTGSTDKTVEIAKSKGCTVINVPFIGFGPTRNSIIDQIDAEWILCFDADEICTPALADEIKKELENPKADAYLASRCTFLMGKQICYSGWSPDYRHAVLFKKSSYRYTDRNVHESFKCQGKVAKFKEEFAHFSFRSLDQLMKKERDYALLGSANVKTKNATMWKGLTHGSWAFVRHYFLRKGFLDGWEGFVIATSAAHGTFFRYALAKEKNASDFKKLPKIPYSMKDLKK